MTCRSSKQEEASREKKASDVGCDEQALWCQTGLSGVFQKLLNSRDFHTGTTGASSRFTIPPKISSDRQFRGEKGTVDVWGRGQNSTGTQRGTIMYPNGYIIGTQSFWDVPNKVASESAIPWTGYTAATWCPFDRIQWFSTGRLSLRTLISFLIIKWRHEFNPSCNTIKTVPRHTFGCRPTSWDALLSYGAVVPFRTWDVSQEQKRLLSLFLFYWLKTFIIPLSAAINFMESCLETPRLRCFKHIASRLGNSQFHLGSQ